MEDKVVVAEHMHRKVCSCLSHFPKEMRDALQRINDRLDVIESRIPAAMTRKPADAESLVPLPLESISDFHRLEKQLKTSAMREDLVSCSYL